MKYNLLFIIFVTVAHFSYAQNVGIGTSDPVSTLNIYHANNNKLLFHNSLTGTLSSDGLLLGNVNNKGGYLWNQESSFLSFGTNSTERMYISQSGNVGIGYNDPLNNLSIYNTTNASFSMQSAYSGTTINDGFRIYTDQQKVLLTNLELSSMALGTNGIERVTITGVGNVGINNTAPAAMLDVFSASSTALKISGGVNITGNGQSPETGKVLTSDANGNATWQGAIAFAVNDLGASNVSIPSGTDVKLIFTIKEFDLGSDFDLTTSEFTAPVKGVYHFDYFVYWLPHTNGSGYVSASIRKNNFLYSTVRLAAEVSGEYSNNMSINIFLNAGDKITPYVYQNSTAGQTVGQDGRQVKFSGYLVCKQ